MKHLLLKRLDPLKARLERQWHGSQAQRLWQAWINELENILPASVRARWVAQVRERVIDWPLTGAADSHADERLILVMPANSVLVQTLLLPMAAVRDLHNVIGFELDRYTPYPRDKVHYVARVTGKQGALAQVLLVVILRERLQPAIERCKEAGLTLHEVDGRDAQGRRLGVDLLPTTQKPPRTRRAQLPRYLALSCAALLLACMMLWLNAQTAMVAAMQHSVEQQREQVQHVQQLRRELINTQGAARYLTQQKAAQPTLSSLLVDLTGCLGADTWVEQLEITDNGAVSLSGQSARASALITRMKDCNTLRDAQFQGIIQPDTQTGKERFSLRAQLRKEASDAP